MINKIILGGILGGIALFVFNAASWILAPWHNNTLLKFENEDIVSEAIRANISEPGVYVLPNPVPAEPGMSQEEIAATSAEAESLKAGPHMFAAVRTQASDGMGGMMAISLLVQILSAALVTAMLCLTRSQLSYGGKILFVLLFAVATSVFAYLPQWNWWGFSTGYTVVAFFDSLAGWFVAGLIIARIA